MEYRQIVGAFQHKAQCTIAIISSLFNIGKQQRYYNSLCYIVLFVSLAGKYVLAPRLKILIDVKLYCTKMGVYDILLY